MRWYDRILVFVFSIVLIVLFTILFLIGVNAISWDTLNLYYQWLMSGYQLALSAVSFLLLILTFRLLWMIAAPKGNKPPAAIYRRNEEGEIAITMETLKALAEKAGRRERGIVNLEARVKPLESERIRLILKVQVKDDTRYQEVSERLQSEVKAYVETISGIMVEDINVLITETPPRSKTSSSSRVQ
jgi:hypothetical protein